MNMTFITTSSPPPLIPLKPYTSFDITSKVSPNVLLIIIILSIIFFISGLIHILVKFLLTPSLQNRDDYYDNNNVTAFQGQLQQLFNLHDSGVEQSLIDKLPVFHYKSVIGLKITSFDCPVCLSEFETEDKLRLLPKCSHAFHVDCIDTWLLSHSTCPLCRSNLLLSDFSSLHSPSSSYLLVLESGSDRRSSRDMVHVPEASDYGSTRFGSGRQTCDPDGDLVVPLEVKLGKFRNVDHVGEGSDNTNDKIISGNSNLDVRRCFSMGSYEYIVDQEATLKVHVPTKKQSDKEGPLPGHRAVMSECGYDPTVKGIGKNVVERESFSLSKIWLRGKKEKQKGTSVRDQECSSLSSSSIRIPNQMNPPESKNGIGYDEENQKSENSESLETKTPSFARRTMLWLAGRQNKAVHPSTSNV
ncbi:putative RING-H2 finger protein ATL49 [Raphanus sativus]|uniref:RING-type E3 ubiquitin transferase n=1 Tax=Raphanus sativus TaxID=3726 RepID=A0A6J0JNP6_RAPSA|nr:putative RING-H2 finger protein ATL49 [Raphanus sativus]KAJ4889002.1 putative RING-H2 finger protein ATL49 [Raphanus sativus]